MSRQSRRRWATVALGTALLVTVPPATLGAIEWVTTRGSTAPPAPPRELLLLALRSSSVPHSGLVQSRGLLALPDLPRLGNTVDLLGGTTRSRVWWAGPTSWRVATMTPTGEQGTYRDGERLVNWDYEESRLTDILGTTTLRLPRPDDLLPPQAARRLLVGVGSGDRVSSLTPTRVVAGVAAQGIRVVPGEARSTIGSIDVWVDPRTGLPVQVSLADAQGLTAFDATFVDLEQQPPDPADVGIPSAPGSVQDATTTPDIVTGILQRWHWQLPSSLAGLPATAPVVGGTAAYGPPLAQFVVLPLSPRLAGRVLDAATDRRRQPSRADRRRGARGGRWPAEPGGSPRHRRAGRRRSPRLPDRRVRHAPGAHRGGAAAADRPAAGAGRVIITRALTKRFGDVLAVDEIDLAVHEGDRYGFLGPNGSGKTTTLRMLLGLVYASSGEIELLGHPVPHRVGSALVDIGSLVESPAAYEHLSGRANLDLLDASGPRESRLSRTPRRERIEEVLDLVGLGGAGRRPVRAYSLGMRQRLGLAMALFRRPRLLVLDEPTNGLDPQGIQEVRELLLRLNQNGTTVFLSSHQLAEVELLCTRVGVMDRGRLVAQAAMNEINRPTGRVVARVGDPVGASAVLAGRVVEQDGERLVVEEVTVPELTRRLVGAGVEVLEVAPERQSLESFVLGLTRPGSDRIERVA